MTDLVDQLYRLALSGEVREAALIEKAADEIERLRSALEAAQTAEPVATYSPCCQLLRQGRRDADVMHYGHCRSRNGGELGPTQYLYAHPPQRKPLTDDEIERIGHSWRGIQAGQFALHVAHAVEAAHGIGRQE